VIGRVFQTNNYYLLSSEFEGAKDLAIEIDLYVPEESVCDQGMLASAEVIRG
jgi:hypothetical protein